MCPGSLKRVKRCCSPLWERQKRKANKKTRRVLLLQFSITSAIRLKQGFYTKYARLSSVSACLCNQQRQASGRFWENRYRRTNQPPQEGKQASKTQLSQREDLLLRWRPCGVPPPLFINVIKQISYGWTRHFGSVSDFWHCSNI